MKLILALALALSASSAYGQTSWCGKCRVGQLTADRDAIERRKRFEKKWGKNADNYPDQTLKRIEKDPMNADCWQYTPKAC